VIGVFAESAARMVRRDSLGDCRLTRPPAAACGCSSPWLPGARLAPRCLVSLRAAGQGVVDRLDEAINGHEWMIVAPV